MRTKQSAKLPRPDIHEEVSVKPVGKRNTEHFKHLSGIAHSIGAIRSLVRILPFTPAAS